MAKPVASATPPNRVERWKKLWGTPRPLSDDATTEVFETFRDEFVPSHMHKRFLKTFGVPKVAFGNRFFKDDAVYRDLDLKIGMLLPSTETHIEAKIIYATADTLEGWALRGESRRSFRDLFVDDWHTACARIEAGSSVLLAFMEPKMKGTMVRIIRGGPISVPDEALPELAEDPLA